MATNRYGAVNTVPLYNVTGRLNRPEPVAAPQFQAPNSGASRNWGSNQGMPQNNPNTLLASMQQYGNPVNLWSMAGRTANPGGGGGDGGGFDGGESGGSGRSGNVYNITFAAQNEGANAKTFTNSGNQTPPVAGTPAAAAQPRQRKPMTQEQRDAKNAKSRAARAAKKAQPQGQATPSGPASPSAPAAPPKPRSPKKAATSSPASTGAMNVSSDAASATQAFVTSRGGSANAPQAAGGNWLNKVGNAIGGKVS